MPGLPAPFDPPSFGADADVEAPAPPPPPILPPEADAEAGLRDVREVRETLGEKHADAQRDGAVTPAEEASIKKPLLLSTRSLPRSNRDWNFDDAPDEAFDELPDLPSLPDMDHLATLDVPHATADDSSGDDGLLDDLGDVVGSALDSVGDIFK